MNIQRWPRSIRWLLFLPAAVLATVITHFVLAVGLSDAGDHVSIFGVGIEGPTARRIAWVWQEGLMRFLEPWAFVATAGVVAPARKFPSIATAAVLSLLILVLVCVQLIGLGHDPVPAVLRAAVGVGGAIVGALTAIRSKGRRSREDVPDEFLELLSKLD